MEFGKMWTKRGLGSGRNPSRYKKKLISTSFNVREHDDDDDDGRDTFPITQMILCSVRK